MQAPNSAGTIRRLKREHGPVITDSAVFCTGVVAAHELKIDPGRHTQAINSRHGLISEGTPSERRILLDLSTALRAMMNFVVISSELAPKSLVERFEVNFLDHVNGNMTEGHTPATAIDLYLSFSSYAPSEPTVRTTTGGPSAPVDDKRQPKVARGAETERLSGPSAKDHKALLGKLKDAEQQLNAQRNKTARLQEQLRSAGGGQTQWRSNYGFGGGGGGGGNGGGGNRITFSQPAEGATWRSQGNGSKDKQG